jgi:sec-independent protein translocase protein TatC
MTDNAEQNTTQDPQATQYQGSQEQPFMTHLLELRDRLLRIITLVFILFVGLFYFANDIYQFLAAPLIATLPEGQNMIATGVVSPFLTPFKLTLVVSIFIAIPYILHQAWSFIAPGLYKHEKRLAFPLLFSSIVLYYAGMAFAYFLVFPVVFGFMATTTPEGVTHAPDIATYLDFALKLFFAFGVAFEVPIATILLILTGATTAEKLGQKRPFIIVGAFVIGMLLTPPDIVSQVMLAIPMWLLFEVGLIFSRVIKRRAKEAREEMTEAEMDDEFEKAIAEEEALNKDD